MGEKGERSHGHPSRAGPWQIHGILESRSLPNFDTWKRPKIKVFWINKTKKTHNSRYFYDSPFTIPVR